MPESEKSIEQKLISRLCRGPSQWTYRPDLKSEEDLWANLKDILEQNNKNVLDETPITVREMEQIKNQLSFSSFYAAAVWIAGENGVAHLSLQRDTKTVPLIALKRDDIAGGSSVYEVINQYNALTLDEGEENRRFDVSLLINGIPLIHVELKNRSNSLLDGFRQIRKYVREGKFTGIFSAVQMFVISNAVDTQYFAAADADELSEKFLFSWADKDNNLVCDYLDFASSLLKIPESHRMVMKYSVLDKEARRLILLRPYQIHAIEAIREASKRGLSGYVWHTTGSGKTMTSYKAARNLIIDIASIEKTIFLIDRKDLDTQTSQAFQSYANNDIIDVDETQSVKDLIDKLKVKRQQVIVTTIQKLSRAVKDNRLPPGSVAYKRIKNLRVAFIVDECHRTVTPETQRILKQFFTNSLWYGFTGTPRFAVNPYPAPGDLPKTTDALFAGGRTQTENREVSSCLHKYTIKEAIRDEAVLGFFTEHLGPKDLKSDDSNEYDAFYSSEKHMLTVLDVILNKSREKLGFQNGGGRAYEALLTVNSIKTAQAYYDLLKSVKEGKTDLRISEETKKVLPDFPKFAITYSVSSDSNDESADLNVPKMRESLEDYNQMFGTQYTIDQIYAYNTNLNDRLARKKAIFKSRGEQLDLVIVVNRLLTGFDAPCLSTVFMDRAPMQSQDIIQAFSRTNRLYDKNKRAGQVVTFRSPHLFKKAVDRALTLYSAGGEAAALAPDWDAARERFAETLADVRLTAATPDVIATLAESGKLRFMKAFQQFDKAYANLRAFTCYADNPPESYGITEEEYEDYAGWYNDIKDKYRSSDAEKDEAPADIDFEYELQTYSRSRIDYDYIVSLMQQVAGANDAERTNKHYRDLMAEIEEYIAELKERNSKLGALMEQVWRMIVADPARFAGKNVGYILEGMRRDTVESVLKAFAEEWRTPLDVLRFAADRYHGGDVADMRNIKESGNYRAWKATTGGGAPKYEYFDRMEQALKTILNEEILPLTDETAY